MALSAQRHHPPGSSGSATSTPRGSPMPSRPSTPLPPLPSPTSAEIAAEEELELREDRLTATQEFMRYIGAGLESSSTLNLVCYWDVSKSHFDAFNFSLSSQHSKHVYSMLHWIYYLFRLWQFLASESFHRAKRLVLRVFDGIGYPQSFSRFSK
jgi:hypothetical protein